MMSLHSATRRVASRVSLSSRRAFSSAPSLAKASGQDSERGSNYENYTAAAQVYDGIRHAGGTEVILGAFANGGTGKPLHQQDVLDIGCGTGNYAAAVVLPVVRPLAGARRGDSRKWSISIRTVRTPKASLI